MPSASDPSAAAYSLYADFWLANPGARVSPSNSYASIPHPDPGPCHRLYQLQRPVTNTLLRDTGGMSPTCCVLRSYDCTERCRDSCAAIHQWTEEAVQCCTPCR